MNATRGRQLGRVIPVALTVIFIAITVFAGHTSEPRQRASFLGPGAHVAVVAGRSPAPLTLGTSKHFYRRAPVVVVASSTNDRAQQLAARAAASLRAPVLIEGAGVRAELRRLKTAQTIVVGTADRSRLRSPGRMDVEATPAAVDAAVRSVTEGDVFAAPPVPTSDAVVVTESIRRDSVALTTARSAGATVVEIPGSDPRRTPAAAKLLKDRKGSPVLALGDGFGRDFAYNLSVVRTAPAQFGGGYFVFPGRVMVALYGVPGSGALGVLGERGVKATIARVKKKARLYQKLIRTPVVPTFEIIATIASSSAGKDKDFSAEGSVARLRPWVVAASKAGVYVVLDLQPGRSDFLSQAKRYESLLKLPHVGLALDPEWRLKEKQKPLRQIGSVGIGEINRTSAWLAALTRKHALPQKLLVLHQFQPRMIRDRGKLDRSHPELSLLIHVDGQGTQPQKRGTWRAIHKGAPSGMFWGWKNFYTEDKPTLTVKKTWRKVRPHPEFISYQ